jgi:iron complex outermembrane receptor protein
MCLMLACLWAAAGIAAAQGNAVSGVVVDPQGAVIVGAAVTLSGGGAPMTARSNAQGSFEFANVAPGGYTLSVEAEGFARYEGAVRVGASPVRARAMLQIGGVAQDVTVRGAMVGTAATGKTSVPLRDLPLTIGSVSREVIEAQGANDLVTALRNVPGVNPFTTYGVYEYYAFRGLLDSVQLVDGVRNEGNRINTQLTNIERIEVL